MRQDRTSWFIVLVLLISLGAVVLLYAHGRYPGQEEERLYCRSAYARAHTAAESLVIDATNPRIGRGQGPSPLTCGILRTQGRLE